MPDHVVTAMGAGLAQPLIVATERVQRDQLVELAFNQFGSGNNAVTGPSSNLAARTHHSVTFYVWDRPVGVGQGAPRRYLQVGFHGGHGGPLFYDDPRPAGHREPTPGDWAWLALRAEPLSDPPVVWFDQDSSTQFPASAVMTLLELKELVMEWVQRGERPSSVEWAVVNSLRWRGCDGGANITTTKR
jgi:hypothetical protein